MPDEIVTVSTQTTELGTMLESSFNNPSIADALLPDFNKARFIQNAIALVNDTPSLAKYSKTKLLPGLLKGAYMGLDFFAKDCFLVPYGETLQFQISYKGMIKMAERFAVRPINSIYAKVIREGDEFAEGVEKNQPYINFTPKPLNDGAIIGAFAVVEYQDGTIQYEVMNKNQLETVKHMGAQSGNAWKLFPEEMYKKSVIKRLCKNIALNMGTEQLKVYNADDQQTREVSEVVNPFSE